MADQVSSDTEQNSTPAAQEGSEAPKPAPQISQTPLPRKPKQDRPPAEDPGIWRMNRRNLLALNHASELPNNLCRRCSSTRRRSSKARARRVAKVQSKVLKKHERTFRKLAK